jgi:hypothetical protein
VTIPVVLLHHQLLLLALLLLRLQRLLYRSWLGLLLGLDEGQSLLLFLLLAVVLRLLEDHVLELFLPAAGPLALLLHLLDLCGLLGLHGLQPLQVALLVVDLGLLLLLGLVASRQRRAAHWICPRGFQLAAGVRRFVILAAHLRDALGLGDRQRGCMIINIALLVLDALALAQDVVARVRVQLEFVGTHLVLTTLG